MTATLISFGTATRTIPVKAPKLTLATVRASLAELGVKIRKTDGEFRVVVAGYDESHAYYTDDLSDALGTGKEMAVWAEKDRAKSKAAVVALEAERPTEPAKPEPTIYRLGSNGMVYAPGIVRWVRAGYWNKPDRQALLRVLRDTWKLPPIVAQAIAESTAGTVDEKTEAFVFEYQG